MGTSCRVFAPVFIFMCMFAISHSALAMNESPQTFTLDGRLFQTGTTKPLLDPNIAIKVQILNPNGTCLLYEEQQTLNTATTDGYFHINVGSDTGSAKRTATDPARTMNQIFQNISNITAANVPGQSCAGGAYSPAAGAVRYFRIIVTPSTTNVADTLSPDIVLDSTPVAMVAQSVQGLERSGILQVNNSGSTVLTQANLEALFTTPAYANLQAILGGNFMKTDSSGAALPSYAANPAGAANGDIWFDSTTSQIKYQTAGGVQTVGAGGTGISSLTVGSSMSVNGTVAGTISSAGTIDLTNTGIAAGTYTKLTVDTKGRATAGTVSLVEGDIPNLTSAGKVSGNTITAGTISGSASINTTGNLITTGTVSGLNVQATNLRVYNSANYVQLSAPALGGNVNLTLPTTDGNPNEFLKTDGSGVLSWASASITSSDVTAALGYTPLNAAATFSGDVSGTYSATTVDRIKGKALTAATVSGQMMIYNGTQWVNSVVSGDATLAYDGILSLNKVPVSKGGTNSTTFGNNRIIASNGTGTALIDFSCSLNQVISFDASGNAVCAAVSSLGGYILNGGNTTGADISIGTNDNKALNFKTNNTLAMTISQGGNVGIGISTPTSQLHNKKTDTSTSGTVVLFKNQLDANPSASSTASFTSFSNKLYQNTNSTGALTGIDNYVGVVKDATTVIVDSNSTMVQFLANVTSLYGSKSYLDNFGSGTVDSAYGFHSSIEKASAGPITNAYGVYSEITTTFGAPPGNAYGIYTGPIQGATKYSFYASDSSAPSFFAGSIGIGTSTPGSALDVNGAMTAQGMSSAPAVSVSNTGRIYYDYSANKFKVSQNGAAYVDLVSSGGITSLGGQTGATQTLAISVDNSVAAPTISSATNAHTWKIPMASNAGTTAGLLNKTDYDLFVAKLGTTTSFAGDVSGAYNATSVDKIKGKAITAGSVSGQMMIYDGTAWNNAVMSGDATLSYAGQLTLNKVPVSKGGTNATTFGNNRIIASNGTGTALVDFTCSLNQVISFDASGNSVCANVTSLSAGILNGGNSTGADISIGTNDNKAIYFKANNTIAMTISQSGKINIGGKADPVTALQVANSAAFAISTPAQLMMWQYKDTTGAPQIIGNWDVADAWGIGTVNTTEKRIRIGIVNPNTALTPMIWQGTQDLILETPLLNVTNGGSSYFNGQVGIGTKTPSTSLDISGAMTAQGMSTAPSVSPTNTGRIYYDYAANKFKVSQNGGAYIDLVSTATGILNGGNTTGADISIGTNDTKALNIKANNLIAMTISQSGDIGIGTTAPGAPVDINHVSYPLSSTNGILAVSSNDAYGIDKGGTLSFGGNAAAGTSMYSFGIMGGFKENGTSGSTAGYLAFATPANGALPTEKMRISSAGNVGIGTNSPSTALDVSGAINLNGIAAPAISSANQGRIYFDRSTGKFKVSQNGAAYADLVGGGAGSGFANGGNAFGADASLGTTDNKTLSIITNNTTAMTISQGGSVGIGVTSPVEKLEVNGNIKATELILSSDRNLKTNILPLENSLQKILSLSGVRYHWRCEDYPERNFDHIEHMGLIAQEVAAIYPDLVHGKEGNMAVDYTGLIAPMIEAIKEQNQHVVSLQNEVSKLKAINAKQESMLLMLMKRVEKLEQK